MTGTLDGGGATPAAAIIAIDGPAASGKSTVGFRVAQELDYLFFDTGVMYRAVTWAALDAGIDVGKPALVTDLVGRLIIDVRAPAAAASDGRHSTVLVDGRDVTWELRTPAVDQNVSTVAAFPGVRQALSAQQRRIGHRYGSGQGDKAGIVMVGRDIGTVVLPDAGLKVYMDASPEVRAQRRHAELAARGAAVDYGSILADIRQRDRIDSGRAHSPLRAAEDAVVIDTSHMTPEAVVKTVVALARERKV